MKIGCQSYTFRLFSIHEAIEKTAEAGGNSIELCLGKSLGPQDSTPLDANMSEEKIAALVEHIRKSGIVNISCFTAIPKDEGKARTLFTFAKKIGARSLTTESVESLDTIEKMVKEFDFRVGFHNHPKKPGDPNYKLWDPSYVKDLVKDHDPRIGSCSDIGHWATSGLNPVECLKTLEGRVINLHIKDRTAIGKATTDQILGRGVLDIPAVLGELKRQKFQGCLFIEYETNWEKSVPDVRQSVEFVRKTAATLK
ncbi:hypothetical protein llg_20570 [Luteolibacter sp. LG18]|nr:hypothetical protein llg_20570 [Luteolibacter sp. LG18]